MSYQIITDSCCDLTEQQYKTLGVIYAPLTVLYQGKAQDNFNDPRKLKNFYDGLRAGETASTSAVNPTGWTGIMEAALNAGKDVLALCFSSALSTTYQSAVIAAAELRERYPERTIRVVDTLAAAVGQGLLVTLACRRRDEGASLDEVTAWVEENKLHAAHWVTVDDLDHLKRGGRINAATAFFGGMLNIKPIIHVDDEGRLINVDKVRGRKAGLDYLVRKFREDCVDMDTVMIGHGDCPKDAATLETLLREAGAKDVITGYVGGVIGAHTGPGVLVVSYLGTKR